MLVDIDWKEDAGYRPGEVIISVNKTPRGSWFQMLGAVENGLSSRCSLRRIRIAKGIYTSTNDHVAANFGIHIEEWSPRRLAAWAARKEDETYHGQGSYGVADSISQVLARNTGRLEHPAREYVLSVWAVRRHQEGERGWRWRKWGEYIGSRKPTYEFLRDEPEIKRAVYFEFHLLAPVRRVEFCPCPSGMM